MNKIETIAMYLPQFHEIPENDQWWGKGYTEWTAVKNAEKLFDGHNQPREPLNDNYYNLLDKSVMEQQSNMAKKYGLDGFCFYHYYFKNGKKILEKPAENLLAWKDLDMHFCFCWANETWARTWSKLKGSNAWSDKYEQSVIEEKNNGILLEQEYDREEAWKEHFEYLLPFFKDQRYIKHNGAPVFLIYKPNDIICLADMMYYWKARASENGINDIYVIGMNTVKKLNGLDAILLNGPLMYWSLGYGKIKQHRKCNIANYQYEEVWQKAIEVEPIPEHRTYFGAFTDFDDTPRRGTKGTFLNGTSVELFEKYLYLLMEKNLLEGNEYIFINAFNEWGEGMYLEPDKKNGYKYLESLQKVKKKINDDQNQIKYRKIKAVTDTIYEDEQMQQKIEKYGSYITLLDRWMTLREEHQHLADYLKKYHYEAVAVYGVGVLGRHLMSELLSDGITVKYTIDRREGVLYSGVKSCKLHIDLEKVDAIIVTAVYEFDNIWKDIRACKLSCPILSLEELIDGVSYWHMKKRTKG